MSDSTAENNNAPPEKAGGRTVSEPVRIIAEQLYARIEAGQYNSRLPAERLLADEFGVPRNTIRGALEVLEERCAISRRAGSGNFVLGSTKPEETGKTITSLQNALVAQNTGPQKLNTVRGIFEPELVRQAVIHTSPKNIDELKQIVDRMDLIQIDPEQFAQCEESFCVQLAHGTENPLLIAIYELITDVRRLSNWKVQRQAKLTPERIRECHARYRLIFEAIERRDAEAAVEILKIQLTNEQDGQASLL